jgi:hypothetical protein
MIFIDILWQYFYTSCYKYKVRRAMSALIERDIVVMCPKTLFRIYLHAHANTNNVITLHGT